MSNRFKKAIQIQEGASNPKAVARELVAAIDEAFQQTGSTTSTCEDPAVRLIAHQLGTLLGMEELFTDQEVYRMLHGECERLSENQEGKAE